ncbi:MAG TPA: tRNA (adenosine(37)-N6)-dimethylallyltransferase MiaA, partial [Salinivirgaceae bacterium]|nr:tRNA (adenosine(37)-N6)-dimethylallyltransferase MiaA [Salinivirgaceae bacterium]
EMCIGTAVPEPEYRAMAPHFFVQSHSIFQPINANDFGELVRDKLKELFKSYPIVFMVGGSGLYIDAVVRGIDDIPSPDPQIRTQLQNRIEQGELSKLQEELKCFDPLYFSRIDIQNPRRILRGLEVYYSCGKPLSSFLGSHKERWFQSVILVLEMDRERLYQRINQRVIRMIEQGLVAEAQGLYSHKEKHALQTVGYQELFDFFDKKITLDQAIEKIQKNTRQFARKQENWFRRYDEAIRVNAQHDSSIQRVVEVIAENYQNQD